MKRYTLTILTTASALLLATNIASAESPVYGGFTSSNGVTLPTVSSEMANHSDTGAARRASEHVYGAFRQDHGITRPETREQLQPGILEPGAIAARMPDVLYGNFVTIHGVTAPIINGDPAQAPALVSEPTAAVAAR